MGKNYVSKMDAEGFNKKTGFNRRGFNRDHVHRNGTLFDDYGRDWDGYYVSGFNRKGYDREGYYIDGYNKKGFNREHMHRNGTPYNSRGFDWEGYSKSGFNAAGLDRYGFRKDGIHSVTGTDRDLAGYNASGIDDNGYDRNGNLDPDVAVAQRFVEEKTATAKWFARANEISEEEISQILSRAAKKLPSLAKQIDETRERGAKRSIAIVMSDLDRVNDLGGYCDFWNRHTRIGINGIINLCDKEQLKKVALYARQLIKDDDSGITMLVKIFSDNGYDLKLALTNVDKLRQKVADREAKISLHDVDKYLCKFKTKYLLPGKVSKDGGKTWIIITEDDIRDATKALAAKGDFICARTLKSHIMALKSA